MTLAQKLNENRRLLDRKPVSPFCDRPPAIIEQDLEFACTGDPDSPVALMDREADTGFCQDWQNDRPDSLAYATAGKGLAGSWLRNPGMLPEIYLEPGDLRRLGKHNAYYNAPNRLFENDQFYQAGWSEGIADREKAMASGLLPRDPDGKEMKFWNDSVPF